MDIAQTGLHHQPFHARGEPVLFVPYHSQLSAYHFLRMILKDDRGVGVFYGPDAAGKTCIIRELRRNIPAEILVADVDAARLKTLELLRTAMDQFDPGPSFESVDDYWYALRILLAEKARSKQTPLLILRNINKMYPSALYTLNKLAELQIDGRYLLRIILISNKAPFTIVHSASMSAVARRSISAFELGPMTLQETSIYVHAKLRASGCDNPNGLFPNDVLVVLHAESGGWPGRLDEMAMQAIERAETWPITRAHLVAPTAATEAEIPTLVVPVPGERPGSPTAESAPEVRTLAAPIPGEQPAPPSSETAPEVPPLATPVPGEQPAPRAAESEPDLPTLTPVSEAVEHPGIQKLFLTLNRKTLQEINLTESKVLIGRSDLCDVSIESRFVSKYHALLIRTDDALHLVDLKTTNGTFVNSERIQSKVLRHDDVISVGNHGIKLICPALRTRPVVDAPDLAETSTMKTLEDIREPQPDVGDDIAGVGES